VLNRVEIIGNLGADPEMRFTANGTAVTTFRVAVGRTFTVDGQKREEVEWFRCVAWQKLAELCGEHLNKGRKVYVEGRQQTRSWDDKGTKKYATELVANQVIFLDKAPTGNGQQYDGPDDIPFEP
jgi:single-strand DNA-binding protein